MATLMDHKRRTRTTGTVENLIPFMINDQVRAARMRPADPRRYAESIVRAAIRRDGRTDAGQHLVMDVAERAAWETANPLPE